MKETENPYISILKVLTALFLILAISLAASKVFALDECWKEIDLYYDDNGEIQREVNIYCIDPDIYTYEKEPETV